MHNMDLRVIARVRKIDEDSLLRELSEVEPEPEIVSYVWRKKYIKPMQIDSYWELEKDKKAVITYKDGTIDIIKENIDVFAKRLCSARKRLVDEGGEGEYPVEEDIEMECEEDEEE